MDYNVVTLEIADLIVHFDYYDGLVSDVVGKTNTDTPEEQIKIRGKNKDHMSQFFSGVDFYNKKKQLRTLYEMKGTITTRLTDMKTKEIHDLVEKLAKDAKKMRKLYLALTKK